MSIFDDTYNNNNSGAEHLADIFGTEKDKVNCPFYWKIGACRHGEKCSRNHNKPALSQTLLIPHMYPNPLIAPLSDTVTGQLLEYSTEFIQDNFNEFYHDVFDECSKYGRIEELNVCDNVADHLLGNVYIKYSRESEAQRALEQLKGRYYAGRVMYPEFSPVTDFKEARCKLFEQTTCERGGSCNFMHLKKVSDDLGYELYGDRFKYIKNCYPSSSSSSSASNSSLSSSSSSSSSSSYHYHSRDRDKSDRDRSDRYHDRYSGGGGGSGSRRSSSSSSSSRNRSDYYYDRDERSSGSSSRSGSDYHRRSSGSSGSGGSRSSSSRKYERGGSDERTSSSSSSRRRSRTPPLYDAWSASSYDSTPGQKRKRHVVDSPATDAFGSMSLDNERQQQQDGSSASSLSHSSSSSSSSSTTHASSSLSSSSSSSHAPSSDGYGGKKMRHHHQQ